MRSILFFSFPNVLAAGLSIARTGLPGSSGSIPVPSVRAKVKEATRLRLSYAPSDLVVLDWAAGVISDPDCADTLEVIEFANVQLLEFRHIDDRLDDRLEAAYRLIRPDRLNRWRPRFWRLHGDAVRQIRELKIEGTSLFERVDNALKLIGDQYWPACLRPPRGGFTFAAGSKASGARWTQSATCTTC